MATNETVKIIGMWASAPCKRVEWALKLKGVDYEYKNEDLPNKSEELLQSNPITKQVPVLVHNGKALPESLVIMEYIDETWNNGYSIMPKDPYERAQARFLAKFTDDKLKPCMNAVFTSPTGEQMQKAVIDFQDNLKFLEEALKGKKFFGGESIGLLDLTAGWLATSLRMLEELIETNVVNEENLPLLNAWIDRFLEVDTVKEILVPKDKIYPLLKTRREQILSGEISGKY